MSANNASLLDRLKSWPLLFLPHQLLSHLVRHATRWQSGYWKNPLIKQFIRYFDVDMSMLEEGYSYALKFVYKIEDRYDEQSETFKFRVD